ncbi:MAG: type III-A CRISPR-associated RAMP protein Csm4 [Paludibacteraceae bacterium]
MAKHTFKIYKLHFTSPLHLGDMRDDYGISLKTIASDTMYAALISCLAKMGKTIPENGDLGCTISSLFPFYQKDKADKNAVLFFPKPLKQTLPKSDEAVKERKKIKKVAWLDASYFSKVLHGEQLFNEQTIGGNAIQGEYMTDAPIDKDFISSQVSPRVTVSRDYSEDAKPFYMDRIAFKGYSGLFFMADGDVSRLEKALNLLQYEGIGTDRNVGNGYFEYDKPSTIELDIPDDADHVVSMSSFVPESKEQLQALLDSDEVAYDFQRRGGWITTPPNNTLRKNVIYAFAAGSVFRGLRTGDGRIVDLAPHDIVKHPVWRCGKAFFLPIKS